MLSTVSLPHARSKPSCLNLKSTLVSSFHNTLLNRTHGPPMRVKRAQRRPLRVNRTLVNHVHVNRDFFLISFFIYFFTCHIIGASHPKQPVFQSTGQPTGHPPGQSSSLMESSSQPTSKAYTTIKMSLSKTISPPPHTHLAARSNMDSSYVLRETKSNFCWF
jgi:hypothetical protein